MSTSTPSGLADLPNVHQLLSWLGKVQNMPELAPSTSRMYHHVVCHLCSIAGPVNSVADITSGMWHFCDTILCTQHFNSHYPHAQHLVLASLPHHLQAMMHGIVSLQCCHIADATAHTLMTFNANLGILP